MQWYSYRNTKKKCPPKATKRNISPEEVKMPVGDTARKLKHDAKVAIQLAFEDLGDRTALVEWANRSDKNLGAFYTQIWCKIIPKDIKTEHVGSDGKPMRMIVAWEEPTTTKTPDE